MSNLKTLKIRIKSIKSTQKITKAMKMVAASRLKKARQKLESCRAYSHALQEMISGLASDISRRGILLDDYPLLTGRGSKETHLLVVISSDRGLCGGLNSATVKYTKNLITSLIAQGRKVKVVCIGKKAYEQLKGNYQNHIIAEFGGIFNKSFGFETAVELAGKILELFNNQEFDICDVIFSKFKSAIAQEQKLIQLIPAPIHASGGLNEGLYLEAPVVYEPNKEEVLSDLLVKNIAIQLFSCMLENTTSEQGARMSAMEAASTNAGKIIKDLTLKYNRTRQANITKELIDIISGANVA